MYAVHFRLMGRLVVDFLLVIIVLFSLGVFVSSQSTRLTDRQTDRQTERTQQYCALHTCMHSHSKNSALALITLAHAVYMPILAWHRHSCSLMTEFLAN